MFSCILIHVFMYVEIYTLIFKTVFAHLLNIYIHLCVCINVYKYMQIWFYSFMKSCTVFILLSESSSKALSKLNAFEVRKRMVLPGSVLKWK